MLGGADRSEGRRCRYEVGLLSGAGITQSLSPFNYILDILVIDRVGGAISGISTTRSVCPMFNHCVTERWIRNKRLRYFPRACFCRAEICVVRPMA